MTRIAALLLAAFVLVACNPGTPVDGGGRVGYTHDDAHHVSCWTNGTSGGVSCLPDSQVTNPR